MPWSRAFDDPIPLPRGRQLVTLKDAANYIQKLPKVEQDLEDWQAAVEALLLVVELNGPTTISNCSHEVCSRQNDRFGPLATGPNQWQVRPRPLCRRRGLDKGACSPARSMGEHSAETKPQRPDLVCMWHEAKASDPDDSLRIVRPAKSAEKLEA